MYLADTNIFLEVLLAGNKSEACKAFLARNSGKIHISDFSLHSIGVILFRQRQEMVFRVFFEDVSINARILSLAKDDGLVKSLEMLFSVIPAKAGIKSSQIVINSLDSGFHRSDDFLRSHQR